MPAVAEPVPEPTPEAPPDAPPAPRRIGRPPRIDREDIVRAAHEIGLADLTVKAVAAHLGVSVGALYHHIDNKDDLLRLAAEYSVTRTRVPDDHGQHWALWLCEWAAYNRDVFAAEPTLLVHYLDGSISPEVIARRTESILAVLVRQGFTAPDALAAYELVAAYGMGAALHAIRADAPGGRDSVTQLRELLARDAASHPHLRSLGDAPPEDPERAFWSGVLTIVSGIAARRGEDWQPVAQLIGGN